MKKNFFRILGLSLLLAVGFSSCKKEEPAPVVTVQKVILDKTDNFIQKGNVAYITAQCKPSNAANQDVIWTTSDSTVVKVFTDEGYPNVAVLYAKEIGNAVITATSVDGGAFATCDVEVANTVAKLAIEPADMYLAIGRDSLVSVVVTPGVADTTGLSWTSSNPSAVEVVPSESGKKAVLKAVGRSEEAVTVRVVSRFGPAAICTVNTYVAVTGITLDATQIEKLEVGEDSVLTATITPADADFKDVTWSVDYPSILDLTSNDTVATIKALAPGKAKVTVTTLDGSFKATCDVTAFQSVKGVSFDKVSIPDLEAGKTTTLTAVINPADASNKNVTWTVLDDTLVELTSDGLVATLKGSSAKRGSTDVIVVTEDGAFADTCKVTVIDEIIHVTGVSVDPTTITGLKKDETKTISAIVAPSTATNKNVNWEVADPTVVELTYDGATATVKGLKEGSTTVTATTVDGSFSASTSVSVVVPVTGVELDLSSVDDLDIDKIITLDATILPSNATNKNVSWSVVDGTVASVTPNGLSANVKGLVSGKTAVVVTTEDGSITDTCIVKVRPNTITLDLNFGSGKNPLGFVYPDPQTTAGETYKFAYKSGDYETEYNVLVSRGLLTTAHYEYCSMDLPYGKGYVLFYSQREGRMLAPAIPGRYLQSITIYSGNQYGNRILRIKGTDLGSSLAQRTAAVATAAGTGKTSINFYSNGNDGMTASMASNKTVANTPYYLVFASSNNTNAHSMALDRVVLTYTVTLPNR